MLLRAGGAAVASICSAYALRLLCALCDDICEQWRRNVRCVENECSVVAAAAAPADCGLARLIARVSVANGNR